MLVERYTWLTKSRMQKLENFTAAIKTVCTYLHIVTSQTLSFHSKNQVDENPYRSDDDDTGKFCLPLSSNVLSYETPI